MERFAARHRLAVTAANGEQIIRYLATTRRWRSAGLIVGLAISIGASLPRGEIQVGLIPLLAGWFVGALVAEARISHLAYAPRRGAALARRGPERYLPRRHRLLIPVAAGLCLAAGVATLTAGIAGREAAYRPAALLLVTGLAVATVVHLMQRHALHRPQPLAEPELLAADDAIRSRSLHVLAGAGAVLVLYCVLGQLTDLLYALSATGLPSAGWVPPALLGYVVVPLYGWAVGVSHWSVPPLPDLPTSPSAPVGTLAT